MRLRHTALEEELDGQDAKAQPFSERELAMDGRKAALDQAAKRAGGSLE